MTDLLISQEKQKKRSSWLLIASLSLLSIQKTNIQIGNYLLEQKKYRNFAPLYLIRQKIAKAIDVHTRPSACFHCVLPSIQQEGTVNGIAAIYMLRKRHFFYQLRKLRLHDPNSAEIQNFMIPTELKILLSWFLLPLRPFDVGDADER